MPDVPVIPMTCICSRRPAVDGRRDLTEHARGCGVHQHGNRVDAAGARSTFRPSVVGQDRERHRAASASAANVGAVRRAHPGSAANRSPATMLCARSSTPVTGHLLGGLLRVSTNSAPGPKSASIASPSSAVAVGGAGRAGTRDSSSCGGPVFGAAGTSAACWCRRWTLRAEQPTYQITERLAGSQRPGPARPIAGQLPLLSRPATPAWVPDRPTAARCHAAASTRRCCGTTVLRTVRRRRPRCGSVRRA